MFSHSDYIALFRNIANTNKQLAHPANFFRITNSLGPLGQVLNIEELVAAQKDGFDDKPFMVLESYEYGFTDVYVDQFYKKKEGAFIIMDAPTDKMDPDAIEEVYNSTELICDDICAWLKKYYAKPAVAAVSNLDLNSFMCEKIGPFGLGYYGTRCAFHIQDIANQSLLYDATKWTANP